MINYYDILGLTSGAGIHEIKAAFRQLAKLYHPDINPGGKEQFTKILKAYETLSDPAARTSYDYKLSYHKAQSEQPTKSTTTKTWRFDDRELKRRQYYNEHFKKYTGQPSGVSSTEDPKETYNEFKYILYATPLAVILFLLIVNLATPGQSDNVSLRDLQPKNNDALLSGIESRNSLPELRNGDSPYQSHFGKGIFDSLQTKSLALTNYTGRDVIVCFFSASEFIRSFYLKSDSSSLVYHLPSKDLYVRYHSGARFDPAQVMRVSGLKGTFTRQALFFKRLKPIPSDSINALTLLTGDNEGFIRIDETDFFKKTRF